MKASTKLRLPLFLALGLCAASASAAEGRAAASANQGNVAQLNEDGASLYASRDYRHAIEKFIQAYAVDGDPNLLFNIARCYEELGETDAAIEKYETFLKTPGADARGRQRARESLTALREAAETARKSPPASASHAANPTGQGADAAAADHADAARGPSYWPWVVLGGSVVSAAVGTTFYMMGVSDHHEVTEAPGFDDPTAVAPITRPQAQDLVDSGDRKKMIGGIALGLAGALAATYVVLLITDDRPSANEGPSLALDVSPKGSSLTFQGSF
jgi:tetratricopeptide (TPR) repeat protein